MKLRKSGRVLLAAAASLGIGLSLTSCGTSNTIDIVFVTASKNNPGQISAYYADSQSGALSQLKDSPFPSGGRNPVAEIVSPDYKSLYVVNKDDSNVVQFGIGTDGKLYPNTTCNTPGSAPVGLAISPDGSLLYVLSLYSEQLDPTKAPYGPNNLGPGGVSAFPISSGKLSCTAVTQTFVDSANTSHTEDFVPVGINPTGITVNPTGKFVFVTAQNGPPNGARTTGELYEFSAASGALSSVAGSPYTAGTAPSAVAVEPRGGFLYVTDSRQNQLLVWTILSAGGLAPNQTGPFKTDTTPVALTVDPQGKFIYVSNSTAGDISAFAIDQGTGIPSAVAGASAYQSGAGSSCIIVDPGLGRFVMTANFNDNTVSSLTLDINKGTLTANQNSPFTAAGQPTCIAAIPHGNHATQHIQSISGS